MASGNTGHAEGGGNGRDTPSSTAISDTSQLTDDQKFLENFIAARSGLPAPRGTRPQSGPEDEPTIETLTTEVIKEMIASVKLTEHIKKDLKKVSDEIKETFVDTRRMYYSIFILGVALVILSVPVALVWKNELFALVFGGIGATDILAFFLRDPPQQLQQSRANLTKLQAAYTTWLTDAANWSIFLYNLSTYGSKCNMQVKDMKDAPHAYIKNFCELMRAIDFTSSNNDSTSEDKAHPDGANARSNT